MADQPVTLAQFETLITAQTTHFDETLENLRIDLMEPVEKIEARLLTAFHNWAGPIAQRMGEYETSRASYASRLAEIETRLYDLERRRGTQA